MSPFDQKDITNSIGTPVSDSASSRRGAPIASEFLSYGSYSGADIKVIVHLPFKLNSEQKQRRINNLQAEINSLEETLAKTLSLRTNTEITKQLNALGEEITNLQLFGDVKSTVTLGNIQTISISVFREKVPVRTLGSVYPRGVTRGPRSIAGSMIFTYFNKHALSELLEAGLHYYSTGNIDKDIFLDSTMLLDQLPPLDISLVFANEYGAISHMGLWGIEFLQEGSTFSIEDVFSECVVQYIGRDFDPMRVSTTRELDDQGVTRKWVAKKASQLAQEKSALFRRDPWQ